MAVRRRIVVSGQVQGVFFRAGLEEEAQRHGVAGWARNRGDGAVEAVLEGAPEAVETVVGWSREGPPRARVAGVEVHDENPEGLTGFEVA